MAERKLERWFKSEVLPLEPYLISFLRHRSVPSDELRDRLHDVYERALIGASKDLPIRPRAYLFTIARNLLISRATRAKIVSFDLVGNLDTDLHLADRASDDLTPERYSSARQQLQRAIEGMDHLPPRCRQVVRLRKLEGLSLKEIAEHQGVSVSAVERQLTLGMRALVDFMLGGTGTIDRKSETSRLRRVSGDND